jgi:hypothetical protein
MGKIAAFLQRKVFGVKVLYLVAVVVVVLLFFALKMESGISDEEALDTVEETSGDFGITDAEATPTYPDFDGTGTVTVPSTSVGTTDPAVTPGSYTSVPEETNETWGRKAIEWLVKNGGASADGATIAIQKYLNGDQLSFAEGELRNKAVTAIGFPPIIPPSGGTLAKPIAATPNPAPAKPVAKVYKAPTTHTITGGGDNTWTELAKLYYQSTAAGHIDAIQAANVNVKGFKHSGEMPKGTKLYIPAKRSPKMYKVVRGKTSAAAIAKANGISEKALRELNDLTKFPAAVGKMVRVA